MFKCKVREFGKTVEIQNLARIPIIGDYVYIENNAKKVERVILLSDDKEGCVAVVYVIKEI